MILCVLPEANTIIRRIDPYLKSIIGNVCRLINVQDVTRETMGGHDQNLSAGLAVFNGDWFPDLHFVNSPQDPNGFSDPARATVGRCNCRPDGFLLDPNLSDRNITARKQFRDQPECDFTLERSCLTRLASTGFWARPPSFKLEPTMTPFAKGDTSPKVAAVTPLPINTGVDPAADLTVRNVAMSTGLPVDAPETITASAFPRSIRSCTSSASDRTASGAECFTSTSAQI